jgi:ABC-type methionine transport system ATPase subunit
LDIPSRQSLLSLLATLRGEFGVTLLIVSHDAAGMSAVCSRSIRLHAGAVVADQLLDEADLHERAR